MHQNISSSSQKASAANKDITEEKICPPHSLSNSDLKTSIHNNDNAVGSSTNENNGNSSQMEKYSLSQTHHSRPQENSFHSNSDSTISSSNKANNCTGNTKGHEYEGSIQNQATFPNALNVIPPPPIPPRSAARHLENVSNIQQQHTEGKEH